jgi:hypothetical protein
LESVKENLRHPIRRAPEDETMYSAIDGRYKKKSLARHGTADTRLNHQYHSNMKNVTASVRNIPREEAISS